VRVLLVVLLVGCGSVSSLGADAGDAGGAAGGGRGGAAGELSAGGRGGAAGELGGAGGRGDLGGAGGTSSGGAGGRACVDQVDTNSPGFSLGNGCNGEPPNTAAACHASCQLSGAHFVGCVANSSFATYCYASCSACP